MVKVFFIKSYLKIQLKLINCLFLDFYQKYPTTKAAKQKTLTTISTKKKVSLIVKKTSKLTGSWWEIRNSNSKHKLVVSCPTFKISCHQGYLKVKSSTYEEK